jgi:hypothetical protein
MGRGSGASRGAPGERVNLSTLTDRELTLLLGHSLFLGHALKTAARAEQRDRLKIGRGRVRAEIADLLPDLSAAMYRRAAYAPSEPDRPTFSWTWARTDRAAASRWLGHPWPSYCKVSESSRAAMHAPARARST